MKSSAHQRCQKSRCQMLSAAITIINHVLAPRSGHWFLRNRMLVWILGKSVDMQTIVYSLYWTAQARLSKCADFDAFPRHHSREEIKGRAQKPPRHCNASNWERISFLDPVLGTSTIKMPNKRRGKPLATGRFGIRRRGSYEKNGHVTLHTTAEVGISS